MQRRLSLTGFVALMMIFTVIAPVTTVNATPSEESEYYYGVEYDWSSLDSDIENVTGLDIQELFTEIMDDADDAGFNLDIGQLTSGSSNVYVHQTEDISPQTIEDADGNDITVWSRSSDVVLRHGLLSNAIIMTDWSETTFGSEEKSFDIDVFGEIENVLTVDMIYTEFLNDDYELVGADMNFDMSISNDMGLDVDILLEGDGEELDVDFSTGIELGYSISSDAEWRLESQSPIYIQAAQNEETWWECVDYQEMVGVTQHDDDEAEVRDRCGSITGSYTGSADYNLFLEGIPTEEFGLDEGEFDITISDELTNSGTYSEEPIIDESKFEINTEEVLTVELADGESIDVSPCTSCPPGNPIMFMMMANVIAHSSVSFGEDIEEYLETELDDSLESILEDIFDVEFSENETESDNSANETEEEEELEPSEGLVSIFEAFEESSLDNVLERFGQNIEETFEEVEEEDVPEFPYTDGMWAPLWSNEHATIVGVGVYAWTEDETGYVLAGPTTEGYSTDLPMTMLSINYITGVPAQEAQEVMVEFDEIDEIFDTDIHNLTILEEALEEAGADTSDLGLSEDEPVENSNEGSEETNEEEQTAEELAEDGGLIPFISPAFVLAILAIAAFAIPRQKED